MVLMNATTIDLPGAVMGFAGVHLALRAEAAGVAHLVAEGDDQRARRRSALLCRVLTAHHRTEDNLLWPALEARQPGFTPVPLIQAWDPTPPPGLAQDFRASPAKTGTDGFYCASLRRE